MTTIIFIALMLVVAVLLFGRDMVAQGISDILELSIRVIGYILALTLCITAIYWVVYMVKSFHGNDMLKEKFVLVVAYLLGSIPFGLIFTKFAGFGDIRHIGSGNIGATNVLRTGNKELALLTLLMDAMKGTVAVLVAGYMNPLLGPPAGLAALIGHMFPVWLKFKGGKGVATAIGVIAAIDWQLAICVMALWILCAYLFRYSSLAAIISITASPFLGVFVFHDGGENLLTTVIIVSLVVTRHMPNIKRLMNKTEPKIGEKIHAALVPHEDE